MAFVPITDLKEADKLWEAGLLWFKYPDDSKYRFDDTYKYTEFHARMTSCPSFADYVDYFILVED